MRRYWTRLLLHYWLAIIPSEARGDALSTMSNCTLVLIGIWEKEVRYGRLTGKQFVSSWDHRRSCRLGGRGLNIPMQLHKCTSPRTNYCLCISCSSALLFSPRLLLPITPSYLPHSFHSLLSNGTTSIKPTQRPEVIGFIVITSY